MSAGTCYARRHMPPALCAFHDYALKVSRKSGVFYGDCWRDAYEFSVDKDTVRAWTKKLRTLGWFVKTGGGQRDRRTGMYASTEFAVLSHSEWVKRHPKKCRGPYRKIQTGTSLKNPEAAPVRKTPKHQSEKSRHRLPKRISAEKGARCPAEGGASLDTALRGAELDTPLRGAEPDSPPNPGGPARSPELETKPNPEPDAPELLQRFAHHFGYSLKHADRRLGWIETRAGNRQRGTAVRDSWAYILKANQNLDEQYGLLKKAAIFQKHSFAKNRGFSSPEAMCESAGATNGALKLADFGEASRQEKFRAFLEIYPNKICDQIKLWALWDCLQLTDVDKALESVGAWCASEQWQEPKFIPTPENFLIKNYWLETPAAAETRSRAARAPGALHAEPGKKYPRGTRLDWRE